MVVPAYELTRLDSHNFEHLVNALAMRVLGAGLTGFGPGADGGRDGFFEGTAPYPSQSDQWSGRWYIQSKFHAPHLSKDPQKWLLTQVQSEVDLFLRPRSERIIPDNWIIATNIELSGASKNGAFDKIITLVKNRLSPHLANRCHVWNGRKILDFLSMHPEIAEYYGEFLTPGNVLKKLYDNLGNSFAVLDDIVRHLTVTQMSEQRYTKLEQAGSTLDNRPGIERLFSDIPFRFKEVEGPQMAAKNLAQTIAQNHRVLQFGTGDTAWVEWSNSPKRARVWFVKGGPGQGKSTLTQYICQIQRAALILSCPEMRINSTQLNIAQEIRDISSKQGLWPTAPRIPISIELKEYAFWFGHQLSKKKSIRVLSYLVEHLSNQLSIEVIPNTLKEAFSQSRWMFIFDGLDEVPGDVKDRVSHEVIHFIDDFLVNCDADAMVVCTSRPQGYSGQFSSLEAATIDLLPLSPEQALSCATPVLQIDRSSADTQNFIEILREALKSPAIAEIMTTPLQSHIMAVIVRDGGRPPEKRWHLFNTFYDVIRKREANRNLPDPALAKLLRGGDKLLRDLHNRLGFELHKRAETSSGAATAINQKEFKQIVTETVRDLQDKDVGSTVAILVKAATERLVLVNTPDNGEYVRFDIRPLQEFFAAEYIYRKGDIDSLDKKIRIIASDSHWREVMHFLISALIENGRPSEVAIVAGILCEIDTGESYGDRAFYRRLAIGAKITSRLLAEGVLEQDKQIRQKFSNAIGQLSSQTDGHKWFRSSLYPHSATWLQEVLLISLREQAPFETIGAALSLAASLHPRSKRVEEVKNFVEQAPLSYQSYFLTTLCPKFLHDTMYYESPRTRKLPKWLTGVALKFLENDRWFTLPKRSIDSAVWIIAHNDNVVPEIVQKMGISEDLSLLLSALFNLNFYHFDEGAIRSMYGNVEIAYHRPSTVIEVNDIRCEVWRELSGMSGYFKAIYSTLNLVKSPSENTVQQLMSSIGGSLENIQLLPPQVRSFLREDICMFDDKADTLLSADFLEHDYPGWPRSFGITAGKFSSDDDLRKLIEYKPDIFLHLLTSGAMGHGKELNNFVMNPDNTEIIIQNFGIRSTLMSSVHCWGILFDRKYPFAEALRNAATANSRSDVIRRPFVEQISTFEMTLPTEAELLPHILGTILDIVERPYFIGRNIIKRPSRPEMCTLVAKYIQKPKLLRQTWENVSMHKRIKAASLVLYMLHPEHTHYDGSKMLIELYDVAESTWLLPGIGYALFDRIVRREPEVMEHFGALIDKTAKDLFGRAALDPLLEALREVPGSPITSSETNDLWR